MLCVYMSNLDSKVSVGMKVSVERTKKNVEGLLLKNKIKEEVSCGCFLLFFYYFVTMGHGRFFVFFLVHSKLC